MCRHLAYAGQPVFLDTLLVEPEASLIAQSQAARQARTVVNGDGCGVGWYGERDEPGLYRGILPAWSDANLVSLCRQIRSPLFLAHVRAATSGEVSTANCHPFAAGRHLFMHNGQIGQYETLRRQVDALIPDEVYHLRRGTSDSEAIFLAALGRGLDADPAAAMAETLAEIMAVTGRAVAVRFAAVHADGERLSAFRWASDGEPPSLYWRSTGTGVVVASEPCGCAAEDWHIVPPGAVLTADFHGGMRLSAFDVTPVVKPTKRSTAEAAASAA
ncbi:class II glutamine amidotransferase [Jiella sp. M17.18]|uniref:class II glutamine amidotransferase n=1 Tax=Jiella sp. M17.18 TaxID=3234247 RepID=UPI0034DEBAC7